ncbi:MAG: metallophosphoesterase [Desulfobacterales bacterium]|nr:metallophosphoesterase [Desulfobacterales bacterium]
MSLFFAIVACLYLVVVVLQYMIIRVMLPRRLSRPTAILISFLFTLSINILPLLYMTTNHILDQLPWWHRELIVFPYAIFMVASAFSGVLLLVLLLARSTLPKRQPRFDKSRRDFVGNAARTLAATSFGVLAYGAYHENRAPEVSRVALPYSRLHPDLSGFRIVQVTDIHAGPFISFESIARIVSMVNALKPDLIVLTGDYVNNNPAYVNGCARLLGDLKANAGVFGVYGNHDYYTGIERVREGFSKTSISMLSDNRQAPKGLEGLLNIIGVEDPVAGWATDARFKDSGSIFELADPERFNLLLSHRPGIFRACRDSNIQLTLAGHTHGGQIIVPMVGERGFSLAGLFFTYTHGLYESEKDPEVRMYVNRGIGTIFAPIRLFCKPEIVEVTLTRA